MIFSLLGLKLRPTRLFSDKNPPGWLVWGEFVELYAAPHPTKSTFHSWEASSADAVDVIRKMTTSPEYWEAISVYYAEEDYSTTIILDHVACVKSICKVISAPCLLRY
jgi:proteasome activator subunit 4